MQHLRFAWRSLRKRPGYATLSILILSLGIGVAAAIYTAADGVLFRPLPYSEPERLVFLWDSSPDRPIMNLAPARLVDFSDRLRTVSGVAGIGHLSVTMTGRGLPERLSGASVSSNFFDVLGVKPLAGRVFHAGQHDRHQVVLTEGTWRQRFGADPHLIGQPLILDGHPWTVAGVMPSSFYWPAVTAQPSRAAAPELWLMAPENELPGLPVAYDGDLRQDRRLGYLRAVARLAPGATLLAARAEVGAVSRQLQREHPRTDGDRSGLLVPAQQQLLGHMRLPVALLLGAAALLFVGSCANVANLQLMRLAERARDLRVQTALGAGAATLAAGLVAEAVILSAISAGAGAAIALATLKGLRFVVALEVPRLSGIGLDVRTFVGTAAIALIAASAIALLPVLRVRRHATMTAGERTPTSRVSARARRWLVGAEVATALALVCGAIMFGESLARLQRVDIGIADVDRLLTFDVVLAGPRRNAPGPEREQFFEEVLRRIRALPGVQHAGAAATLPIGGDDFGTTVIAEHPRGVRAEQEVAVGYQVVGTDWFPTLGVRLLAGRDFTPADTADRAPVALINRTLAHLLWPGKAAVGRRLRTGPGEPWMTVVGVVADLKHLGPRQPARPEVYQPLTQQSFSFAAFALRTSGDPHLLADTIRREVASLDPGQPISNVRTMGEHLRRARADTQALSTLTALFGALALLVAALGIYGAVGFSVTQRMREFGVRLALGAAPRDIRTQVLRETLLTAAGGLAAGLLFARAGARMAASLLFETPPAHVTVYAVSALVLVAVAIVAGWWPARHAMRADPATVLKAE